MRGRFDHDLCVGDPLSGLDPMGFPELLDALGAWIERGRAGLEGLGLEVIARDQRDYDKWCGTVEVAASQRVGYLSVWSSGELDCQVVRAQDFYVLNEHRLVQSAAQLERSWRPSLKSRRIQTHGSRPFRAKARAAA